MKEIRIGDWRVPLPRSSLLRIIIGVVLVLLGFLGFLPVLGFWMIPLGVLIISYEVPLVRRWRRRFVVWLSRVLNRRYPALARRLGLPPDKTRQGANGSS